MGAVSTLSIGRLPRRRLGRKRMGGSGRGCKVMRTFGLLIGGGCCVVVYKACVLRRLCNTVVKTNVCCVA